jgi:hypothetical protein
METAVSNARFTSSSFGVMIRRGVSRQRGRDFAGFGSTSQNVRKAWKDERTMALLASAKSWVSM